MTAEPPPIPQDMLISATRYALGRGTYIVNDTVEVLVQQAEHLAPRVRSVLLRDIGRELDDTRAMPDDHRKQWQRAYSMLMVTPAKPQDYSTFYRLIGAEPASGDRS
jgi:hypothetical protein